MKLVTEMELFSVNYYKNVSIEMNRKGHNTEAMESDSSVSHSASTPYQLGNIWQFI